MAGLMVADDEAIVRSALIRMISQNMPDLGPVLEAMSGEEAISLARQAGPGIVLMDVKMPGVSGLEAARTIRRDCPSTRIIMLTAYDEFSFAQEALRLGAVDYLLKPVRPALLFDVLTRAQQQLQKEEQRRIADEEASSLLRETLPLIEARLVQDLISGQADAETVIERVLARLGKTLTRPAVMVLEVDNYDVVTAEMDGERRERFDRLLLGIVRRVLPAPDSALACQVRAGTLVIILSTDAKDTDLRGVRTVAQSLRYAVESGVPATATIGIGRSYPELGQIPESYAEAVRAQLYRPVCGGNCVIYINDLPKVDQRTGPPYPVELERELLRSIEAGERQPAEERFNTMMGYLLAQPDETLETVRMRLVELMALASRAVVQAGAPPAPVLNLSHRQTTALGRLKSLNEMRAWAVDSLSLLLAQVEPGDHADKLVNNALQYMRDNLSRSGLELKDVARAVNLSNSHLAHLLKSKNGTSYVKYLTQLRIEEAKKLLATTDLTIAAVSVAVGYEDAAYFHRVFRRETSMTPSSYRQAQRSGKLPGTPGGSRHAHPGDQLR